MEHIIVKMLGRRAFVFTINTDIVYFIRNEQWLNILYKVYEAYTCMDAYYFWRFYVSYCELSNYTSTGYKRSCINIYKMFDMEAYFKKHASV